MSYQIVSLHIYPIKSCAGIELTESEVTPTGLRWDRNWMIVDADGVFLSQRKHSKMALIKTALRKNVEGLFLDISVPGFENEFSIATFKEPGETRAAKVWNSEVEAHVENDDINKALSHFLGQKVFLVRFGEKTKRHVEVSEESIDTDLSFTDSLPILLTNTQSLADLNMRLNQKNGSSQSIPMNRFRPNVVIVAENAFEEDNWKSLKIANVELECSKPCSRCVVITVDQETAEPKGPEPLKTLTEYRKFGRRVNFGQFVTVKILGKISVKDKALVLFKEPGTGILS